MTDSEKVIECRKVVTRLLQTDRHKMVSLDWVMSHFMDVLKFGEGCDLGDYAGAPKPPTAMAEAGIV